MGSVVDLFLEQVMNSPDACAIVHNDFLLTYKQLDSISANIAHMVTSKGCQGEIVGIYSGRCAEFICAALGIMRAGSAYVALDSNIPQARLEKIIDDAKIKIIFTSQDCDFNFSPTLDICPVDMSTFSEYSTKIGNSLDLESVAYLIYTSGSTGEPKGTIIPHRCIVNFVCWMIDFYQLKSGVKTSWIARPSFDASLFEIWPYICSGGTIHIPEDDLLFDPEALIEWIAKKRLDNCFMPTPLAESCLDCKWPEDINLQYLFSGGDALRKVPPMDAPFRMFDHYGPSECTVVSTVAEIKPTMSKLRFPNIGKPIAGYEVYILDQNLNSVPDGEVGDIYIAGAGVGLGYLNSQELTQSKYLPNPFAGKKGGKIYKTGDLGVKLPDGSFEFHGRNDYMVKIRGYRIELGEIETVLRNHPKVSDVAVVAIGEESQKRIVAFVSPLGGLDCTKELKDYTASILPEYMMPSNMVIMQQLPKNINGKIDRASLLEYEPAQVVRVNRGELSDNAKKIIAIWKDVLKIGDIDADANFFDVGGHSLKAYKVVSRINLAFGSNVTIKDLFDRPTVRQLEELIKDGKGKSACPIEKKGSNRAPLTPGQQHMWLLDSFQDDLNLCNIVCDLKFSGQLDLSILERAIQEIYETQQSLHAKFVVSEDFEMRVLKPKNIVVGFNDLSDHSKEDQQILSQKIIEDLRNARLNLSTGDVCRFTVIKYAGHSYRLISLFHHAIADGSSMGVFVNKLKDAYEGLLRGMQPPILPPEVGYTDYSTWFATWLESNGAKEELEYWKGRLKGINGGLTLKCANDRPDEQTFVGNRSYFNIDEEAYENITNFCKENNITGYMFFLAVYMLVLRKNSDSNDIVVGCPIANRPFPELEEIIGLFINSVVQRIDVTLDTKLKDLLNEVKERTFEAFKHQSYPFEKIVEALRLKQDASMHPIFQHLFIYQNSHVADTDFAGGQLSFDEIGNRTAKLDLTLNVEERMGAFEGWFEYNEDIFSNDAIIELVKDLTFIAKALVDFKNLSVEDLIHKNNLAINMLEDCMNTPARIVDYAITDPGKKAIEDPNNEITFGQLNAASDVLACELLASGLQIEEKVGILCERGIEFIVAALAVMKSGGAFVPLDIDYPSDRVNYIIENSQIKQVFCKQDVLPDITSDITLRKIDIEQLLCQKPPRENVLVDVPEHSLAYTIYTSGSTGKPKGVEIEHCQLTNQIDWNVDFYKIGPKDIASHLARSSFDTSVSEIWTSLSVGATVVVAPTEIIYNPTELVRWVCKKNITLCLMTTPLAEYAVQEPWPKDVPLRALRTAGDRLKVRPPKDLPFPFYNEYGPTECTVTVTLGLVSPEDDGTFPHIGKAIGNNVAHILDEKLNPVADGQEGELCISGKSVGRGYVKLPEQTAEKFLQDPFIPGNRIYRTGDVVKRRPDGNIDYVGRLDFQVQIRGFRVELSEIEKVMMDSGVLKDVCVVDLGSGSDIRLVCFFIGMEETEGTRPCLCDYVSGKLPQYMVPSQFLMLDDFPKSRSGKIDRDALRQMAAETGKGNGCCNEKEFEGTQTEKEIANVWQGVLGHNGFSKDDNFFDVGGHSLKAFRIITQINEAFGTNISISKFFDSPTISSLAKLADLGSGQKLERIAHTGNSQAPATMSQVSIWMLDSFQKEINVCKIISKIKIEGQLNKTYIENTLRQIYKTQQSLRMRFDVEDEYVIYVQDLGELPYEWKDLSDLGVVKRQVSLDRILADVCDTEFDLSIGNVCRFVLVKESDDSHYLFVALHHAIADGGAMGTLLTLIKQGYEDAIAGGGGILTEPPINYVDYATWLPKWLGSAAANRQLEYWLTKLDGIKGVLRLDCENKRPEKQTFRGDWYYFDLDEEISNSIYEYCKRNNVTEYMFLLAIYAVLLRKHSNDDDIVIGSPFANRAFPELDDVIGLFINTLAQRINISPELSFKNLLEAIKTDTLEAFDNQTFPFEKILPNLKIDRNDSSIHPVFQHMFAYQNAHIADIEFAGLRMSYDEVSTNTSKLDLNLNLESRNGRIEGWFEYNTNIFNKKVIGSLICEFRSIAMKTLNSEDMTVGDLLNSSGQESQVTQESDSVDYVPARIVNFAIENPDKIAIEDSNNTITFGQLNSISDLLACRLIDASLEIGEKVGLFCERGIEFIVAAFAVLKAGGAFVPLEVNYPVDRIKYMIDNSDMRHIFCKKSVLPKIDSNLIIHELSIDELLNQQPPRENVLIDVPNNSLAYSIYTSGSTGKPKGVEIEHAQLTSVVDWNIDFYKVTADDVASHIARSTFDASISEIWASLATGAKVIVAPDAILYSPAELVKWICEKKITLSMMTTPLAERALQEYWPNDVALRALKTIGDRLKVRPSKDLPFPFYNEYGPTECAVAVTVGLVSPDDDGTFPHIGKAVGDNVIHILDDKLNPVQDGQEGELCISGKSVGRGYAKMPEQTAERFLADPLIPGNRMYRTGDVVKRRADGNIDYIGRLDFQVQIRGFRVELSEIERVIFDYGVAKEVAVVANEKDTGYELICFISCGRGVMIDQAALRNYLTSKLPNYMIPQKFVNIEAMPLNANGKIDRKALLQLAIEADGSGSDDVAQEKTIKMPRNPMEEVLWEIWKVVLKRSDFGVYDNFFDLGGHSLMLMKMESLLSKRGLAVSYEKVIQNPQIAKLAAYLDFKRAGGEDEKANLCLVELNKGDANRKPIYFIHSMSGDVLGYANLVNGLGKDQPCYGFQSSCLSDTKIVDNTIVDMAKRYVDIMVKFQPEGPYMLSGWCFGGFIAYEMARILKNMGKEVGLLVLIDTPSTRPSLTYLPYYFDMLGNFISQGPAGMLKFCMERLKREKQSLMAEEILGEGFSVQDDDIKNTYVSNRTFVYGVNFAAIEKYRASRYDGDILLCTAEEREQWILRGKTLGWKTLVQNVKVEQIPGGHMEIMKISNLLADTIRKYIDEVIKE